MQERGGGRVTPHTARAVTAISDGERAARVLFMESDGFIDEREEAALDLIAKAGHLVSLTDTLRRIADWVRDAGQLPTAIDISPYLMTEWRQLHKDMEPDSVA